MGNKRKRNRRGYTIDTSTDLDWDGELSPAEILEVQRAARRGASDAITQWFKDNKGAKNISSVETVTLTPIVAAVKH
jgi:hypothetical protein